MNALHKGRTVFKQKFKQNSKNNEFITKQDILQRQIIKHKT